MNTLLEALEEKRRRVATLQKSELIIDQKKGRLAAKKELVRAGIAELGAELAGADQFK